MTVRVVGKPGRYGWSKRLRKGENCVVARWQCGDLVSVNQLRLILDALADAGKISQDQSSEFFRAIRRLDENAGKIEDLRSVRTLAKVLGMRVIVKVREPRLPYVKPRLYSSTYWEAYGLVRYLRRTVPGVDVRVRRVEQHAKLPACRRESRWRPGGYSVSGHPIGQSCLKVQLT